MGSKANFFQLDVLFESEEAKGLIISAHGMLPILEILEPCTVKSRQSTILRLLKVVNTVSIVGPLYIQANLLDYIERCRNTGEPVLCWRYPNYYQVRRKTVFERDQT